MTTAIADVPVVLKAPAFTHVDINTFDGQPQIALLAEQSVHYKVAATVLLRGLPGNPLTEEDGKPVPHIDNPVLAVEILDERIAQLAANITSLEIVRQAILDDNAGAVTLELLAAGEIDWRNTFAIL